MFKKLITALLTIVLTAGLTPCLAWAADPLAAAQPALTTQSPSDIATARQAVDAAQAEVDAAKAAMAKGSLGFFESVGATSAVDALTGAKFASYTKIGSETDATSLANMEAAIDIVERCNEIRAINGLGALTITDYLMATSQSDANYSDTNIGHAQQFSVAENLAWNCSSSDLSAGVKAAFTQWYDSEKEVWDSAKSTGSYTSKNDGTIHEIPASAFSLSAYELMQQYNDFYLNVGHYLNVIGPDFVISGGAINTNGTNYGVTYAQNFGRSSTGGEQAYSVAEYRERFTAYCDKLRQDLDSANAKLSTAKADLAKLQTITAANVKVITPTLTFDGTAKKPAVTVTFDGITLSEGTDYTVDYANNVNAGAATARVKGMGSYSGEAKVTFTIAKAANPITVKAAQKTVKLSKLKKKAQVVAAISVSGAVGKVTFAKVAKGSSPKLSVNKSTGKLTVKKKTPKGAYKANVKVMAAGNANHASLSKTVAVKVRVK